MKRARITKVMKELILQADSFSVPAIDGDPSRIRVKIYFDSRCVYLSPHVFDSVESAMRYIRKYRPDAFFDLSEIR